MSYLENLLKADPQNATRLLELSQMQGAQYLQHAAEWIRDELEMFAVSIGEITGPACDQIRLIGFSARDLREVPESYCLTGTPCIDVIDSNETICIVDDAAARYPDDETFQELGIQAYIGLPLRDGFGRIFGVLCAFDDQRRNDSGKVLDLLSWFAPRMGNEAGTIRTRRNLVNSVSWMERAAPDDLFASATSHLSQVLQVTTSFVVEWVEDEPGVGMVRTLRHLGEAVSRFQGLRVQFAGMPFERMLENDAVIIPDGLQSEYPDDPVVKELKLKSLIGFTIRDHDGEAIGHIGVAHTRPMEASLIHSPVFVLYKARLAAELTRLRDERRHDEIQRALSVRHKLESIGLMAGHIAHDFNNLLMAILGNANLAAGMLDKDSPARRFIENIEAASTAAGDVVSHLLDYAGRKPTQAESVPVSEAVENASRLVELSHYPAVEVDYQLATAQSIQVDPARFQQIIVNLVLNAAEALSGGPGVIRISTASAELGSREIRRLILGRDLAKGEYVRISVTDDGVGMDEVMLSRVFDPFFTSKPEGRGLGLSAVSGFIEGCDGGLDIATEPGNGTRISLYLQPVADSDSATRAPPKRAREVGSPRILVVDDEPVIGEMAARMLQGFDYKVHVCTDCDSALEAARDLRFGCALVDVRMPRIDGWTTVRQLRELQPGLPLVMMTGFASDVHPAELLARFNAIMLQKPFSHRDLLSAVERAVRNHAQQLAS